MKLLKVRWLELKAFIFQLLRRNQVAPLPQVEVDIGPVVPAWILHLAAALLTVLLVGLIPLR